MHKWLISTRKKCSASPASKEIHIKTTTRYHFAPTRTAVTTKKVPTSVVRSHPRCWWEWTWCSCCRNQSGGSSKGGPRSGLRGRVQRRLAPGITHPQLVLEKGPGGQTGWEPKEGNISRNGEEDSARRKTLRQVFRGPTTVSKGTGRTVCGAAPGGKRPRASGGAAERGRWAG